MWWRESWVLENLAEMPSSEWPVSLSPTWIGEVVVPRLPCQFLWWCASWVLENLAALPSSECLWLTPRHGWVRWWLGRWQHRV